MENSETEGFVHPTLLQDAEGKEVIGGYTRGNSQHRGRSSRDSVAPNLVPRPNVHHADPAMLHRFTKVPLFNKHRLQRIHRGSRFDTWNYRLRIQPRDSTSIDGTIGDQGIHILFHFLSVS